MRCLPTLPFRLPQPTRLALALLLFGMAPIAAQAQDAASPSTPLAATWTAKGHDRKVIVTDQEEHLLEHGILGLGTKEYRRWKDGQGQLREDYQENGRSKPITEAVKQWRLDMLAEATPPATPPLPPPPPPLPAGPRGPEGSSHFRSLTHIDNWGHREVYQCWKDARGQVVESYEKDGVPTPIGRGTRMLMRLRGWSPGQPSAKP